MTPAFFILVTPCLVIEIQRLPDVFTPLSDRYLLQVAAGVTRGQDDAGRAEQGQNRPADHE
jgi:hypothetical protein